MITVKEFHISSCYVGMPVPLPHAIKGGDVFMVMQGTRSFGFLLRILDFNDANRSGRSSVFWLTIGEQRAAYHPCMQPMRR